MNAYNYLAVCKRNSKPSQCPNNLYSSIPHLQSGVPLSAGAIGYMSVHYQFQNKVCHKQAAVVKILWMNLCSSTH
jgi:hypothetical protein